MQIHFCWCTQEGERQNQGDDEWMMDDKIAVELDDLKLARKLQDFMNTEC